MVTTRSRRAIKTCNSNTCIFIWLPFRRFLSRTNNYTIHGNAILNLCRLTLTFQIKFFQAIIPRISCFTIILCTLWNLLFWSNSINNKATTHIQLMTTFIFITRDHNTSLQTRFCIIKNTVRTIIYHIVTIFICGLQITRFFVKRQTVK